jgi:hypothetical protein
LKNNRNRGAKRQQKAIEIIAKMRKEKSLKKAVKSNKRNNKKAT